MKFLTPRRPLWWAGGAILIALTLTSALTSQRTWVVAFSGGNFTQINPDEEITWRAMELLVTLNTARLLSVAVVDTAVKHTFLCHGESLADGEELCAIARLDKNEKLPAAVACR